MIVRVWRAQATTDGAARYRVFFEQHRLPGLRRLAGFQKAYLLHREREGGVEIEVQSLWDSFEAIRAFAGADVEAAVVEPEIQAMVTRYETTVTHFTAEEYGR